MSWRIIYIESSDYLNLYLDNLKITKGIEKITIPLSDVNSIIIDNHSLVMSASLISKCMEYNINIVICDPFHLPSALIFPYSGNYNSSFQLRKQLEWEENSKMYIWQEIVKAKIKNQKNVMEYFDANPEYISILDKYYQEVELNDKTNREGLAAKIYFRELFGDDFLRKSDDVRNSALNYGYSILRSQICRALVARGLNPHFGIFHRGPSNPFNLADDVIEVFRPIVDQYVLKNLKINDVFTRNIRVELVAQTTKKVMIDGKIHTINNAIIIMVDSIISFFETGNIDEIKFPGVKIYE